MSPQSMLQVPELKGAMGLPETYLSNHGTRRDKVRLLENGVAPPVMRAVVESLTQGDPMNAVDRGGTRRFILAKAAKDEITLV